MFDIQSQFVSEAAQVEVRVSPGVELGRAAQRLTGPYATGAFFGVMDDEHSEGMPSLQFAQVREQGRHLTAGVFVDAMQAHERIQHQQPRFELLHGVLETGAIRRYIQPQSRGRDHMNI
jgi:hypothetical protein